MLSVPAAAGKGLRALSVMPRITPPLEPPAVMVPLTGACAPPLVGVNTDEMPVPGLYVTAYVPLWTFVAGWPWIVEIHGLVGSLLNEVVAVMPDNTWKTACGLLCSAAVSLVESTERWFVEPAAAPNAPVVMPMLPRLLYAAPVGTMACAVAIDRKRSAIPAIVGSPVSTDAVLVFGSYLVSASIRSTSELNCETNVLTLFIAVDVS